MQVEASTVCGCCALLAVATPQHSPLLAKSASACRQLLDTDAMDQECRCSIYIALKPVMHCSLVIARAFYWHISLPTAHPLSFIVDVIAQPFFKLRMPRFLVAKCPTITILLKLHFIFCASHEYNFRSHRTSFPLHGFQCFPLLQLS